MGETDYTSWSDEDLTTEAARLAAARTRVRLAINAVASEIEIRGAMAAMTPETRRVLSIRLSGEINPAGDAEATVEEGQS